MYSILKTIEQYARNFGIPFKEIIISSTYFPEYFNKTMLEELNKLLTKDDKELYIKEYVLSWEENGELKLMAYTKNGKSRLVIFPEDRDFDYNITGKKFSEFEIISRAKIKEIESINEINFIIRNKGLSKRVNLEVKPFTGSLKQTAKLCIAYIDYCNKYYQESLRKDNEEEKSIIRYNTPETSSFSRGTRINQDGTAERVSNILSVEERVQILESYNYIYSGYGYSRRSSDIEYFNYLYDIGDNYYALLMEPYNGTSATKIQIIKSEEEISKPDFELLVKTVLSLSFSDLCSKKDVIRLYHSDLESFENKLSIVLTGKAKYTEDCSRINLMKKITTAKS